MAPEGGVAVVYAGVVGDAVGEVKLKLPPEARQAGKGFKSLQLYSLFGSSL